MKGILLTAGMAIILFTSCDTNSSKDDKAYIDSTLVPPTTATQTITPEVQNNVIQASQPQAIPVNTPAIQQTTPGSNTVTIPAAAQQQAPATNTVTAPGMNPPHGQPGHRCDINVGAPLNSKPNPPPAVTQQPVQANMSQPPSNATLVQQPVGKTAPGMNPPHGQPGHRCDISVGAPLNSKPAPQQPVKASIVQEPVKKDSGS